MPAAVTREFVRNEHFDVMGPVFAQVEDWESHIATITAFWSSVALMSGRYHGQPMAAHLPLGLDPEHFERWLALFERTAREICKAFRP